MTNHFESDSFLVKQSEATPFYDMLLNKGGNKVAVINYGPSGTGKTTFAKTFIKLKQNLFPSDRINYEEINCAQNNSVEFIRQFNNSLYKRAVRECHFYIFDEAHNLTKQAWDALLITLENLPEFTYIFFCTTSIKKIPNTIISRTLLCYFYPYNKKQLEQLCAIWGYSATDSAIKKSSGNAREMLKLIKQEYIDAVEKADKDLIIKEAVEKEKKRAELVEGLVTTISIKDDKAVLDTLEIIQRQFNSIEDFLDEYHRMIHDLIINKKFDSKFLADQLLRLVYKSTYKEITWPLLNSLFILDTWEKDYIG